MLQGVLDSARSLIGERYGAMTLLTTSSIVQDNLSSWMSEEEKRRMWDLPDGRELIEYTGGISEPLGIPDLLGYTRLVGFSRCGLPLSVGRTMSLLAMPVQHRGGARATSTLGRLRLRLQH